jgi:hypothetical protein
VHLFDWTALLDDFFDASLFLAIGATGVLLVVLGLRREDAARPVFLVAGIGLAFFGFGVHFLGWSV